MLDTNRADVIAMYPGWKFDTIPGETLREMIENMPPSFLVAFADENKYSSRAICDALKAMDNERNIVSSEHIKFYHDKVRRELMTPYNRGLLSESYTKQRIERLSNVNSRLRNMIYNHFCAKYAAVIRAALLYVTAPNLFAVRCDGVTVFTGVKSACNDFVRDEIKATYPDAHIDVQYKKLITFENYGYVTIGTLNYVREYVGG